ncbi:MAG: YegS/Rv2252/BmrU family lipid kinase, partial [Lysinibacillus sp.]|nr:YegS/Rv2252/BmrU family lipid kinase [Lysinibacillus sp.]
LKGIEMLPSIKATNMRFEMDGEVFEGEVMAFLCALTNSVGGFEKIAPDSSINDGYFTMMILKKCNLADFVRVLTLALRGEHLTDPNVIYRKASTVKVTSDEEIHINLDGELGGKAPATFQNFKRHIEVFVPIDDIREQDRI